MKSQHIKKDRLLQKGYDPKDLQPDLQSIAKLDRNDLLVPKRGKINNQKFETTFITTFSNEYRQIIKFIKHWKVLKSDPVLGPTLTAKPNVIFRKACTLRDMVAPV